MGGAGAIFTEVIGCVHQALAEVEVPDAVDDGAPGEGVLRIGDPLRQRGAAGTFVSRLRDRELGLEERDTGEGSGTDLLQLALHVPAREEVDRTRSPRDDCIDGPSGLRVLSTRDAS